MAEIKPLSPKKIGAIISAYTGKFCGDEEMLISYAKEVLGNDNITWADFDSTNFKFNLKMAARDDWHDLHIWCGGKDR